MSGLSGRVNRPIARSVAVACVAAAIGLPTDLASASVAFPIGLGTVSPATGGLTTDLQLNAARSCPSPATGFDVRFSGGQMEGSVIVNDYTPLADVLMAPDQADPMTVALGINLETAAAFGGVSALTSGVYSLTLRCRTAASDDSLGDFVGAILLTADASGLATWTRAAWPMKATVTSVTGPDRVGYQDAATYHVDVKAYRGVPLGTVQLFADGLPVSAARALVSGAVDLTVNSLPPGDHTITARYTPSQSDFLNSSSEIQPCNVRVGATSLELTARASGGSAHLTAVITPPVDGVVTFHGVFGTRAVRAVGGQAAAVVPARGGSFSAHFVPHDSGFGAASAAGAISGGAPAVSTPDAPAAAPPVNGPPAVRSPRHAPGPATVAPRTPAPGVPSAPATSSGPTASPTPGRTPAPATPATAAPGVKPAGPSHADEYDGNGVMDPLVTSGTASNPSTDGSLTISVHATVTSTSGGSASTSYGVNAPIGGTSGSPDVVVLDGGLDASAQYIGMQGSIVPVVVRDTRAGYPGYEVTATMTDLSDNAGNSISANNVGWTPAFISASAFPSARLPSDAGLSEGLVVPPADTSTPPGDPSYGLGVDRQLFISPAGVWAGTVTYGAIVLMHAPTDTPPGDYHAVLTLTVTGAVL